MKKTSLIIAAALFAVLAVTGIDNSAFAQAEEPTTRSVQITVKDPETGEDIGRVMFLDLPSEEPARSQRFMQIRDSLFLVPLPPLPATAQGQPGGPNSEPATLDRQCGSTNLKCTGCPPGIKCCPGDGEKCDGSGTSCTCIDVIGRPGGGVNPGRQ